MEDPDGKELQICLCSIQIGKALSTSSKMWHAVTIPAMSSSDQAMEKKHSSFSIFIEAFPPCFKASGEECSSSKSSCYFGCSRKTDEVLYWFHTQSLNLLGPNVNKGQVNYKCKNKRQINYKYNQIANKCKSRKIISPFYYSVFII